MADNIEDNLTPTNATEVALLARIGELRRKLWESGRYHNTADGFPLDPNAVPIEVRDFSPVLRLAGTCEASLDVPRGLRIEARTHGPLSLGVANYIGTPELLSLRPGLEANLLTKLHERVIRQTGKLLHEKLREPAIAMEAAEPLRP